MMVETEQDSKIFISRVQQTIENSCYDGKKLKWIIRQNINIQESANPTAFNILFISDSFSDYRINKK